MIVGADTVVSDSFLLTTVIYRVDFKSKIKEHIFLGKTQVPFAFPKKKILRNILPSIGGSLTQHAHEYFMHTSKCYHVFIKPRLINSSFEEEKRVLPGCIFLFFQDYCSTRTYT